MNKSSYDQLLLLKRVFLPIPQAPPTVWPLPSSLPRLQVSGEAVQPGEDGGWVLDFGPVPAVGVTMRSVSLENLIQEPVTVWLEHGTRDIACRWADGCSEAFLEPGGGQARLDLYYQGTEPQERDIRENVVVTAETPSGSRNSCQIAVHLATNLDFACGRFCLNGAGIPERFDFGSFDPVDGSSAMCRLAVENLGKKPLDVALDQLPDWLVAKVEGRPEGEPPHLVLNAAQQAYFLLAPVHSLDYLGRRQCPVRLRSNDIRPEFREVGFLCQLTGEIAYPYVTFDQTEPLASGRQECPTLKIPLFNWGNTPALLKPAEPGKGIVLGGLEPVPPRNEGGPGTTNLSASVDCSVLPTGANLVSLEFQVLNGPQTGILIQQTIQVIDILAAPDEVDFGKVDMEKTCVRTVMVTATDDRELLLAARPLPAVEDWVETSVVNGRRVELRLRVRDHAAVPVEGYCGEGVEVLVWEPRHRLAVPVRFTCSAPVLRCGAPSVPASLFGGSRQPASLEIGNEGDGVLRVRIGGAGPHVEIPPGNGIEVAEGETLPLPFMLDFRNSAETEARVDTYVDVVSNSVLEPCRRVPFRLTVRKPAGWGCPECDRVMPLETKRCSNCGVLVQDEYIVAGNDVKKCPKCGRQYLAKLKFCPLDGKIMT